MDSLEKILPDTQAEIAGEVCHLSQARRCPVLWRQPFQFLTWLAQFLFGLASLVFMLAVIAAIPVINFLALGYLLEVERRVCLNGRLNGAFPWLEDAPRIGALALGTYLWLLPLRLLGSRAADAHLIDPGGIADQRWHLCLNVAWVLITLHLILAIARGGSLGCFVRPIKNARWLYGQLRSGGYLHTAGQHINGFLGRMGLRHLSWLGVRGFAVAFLWLLIPTGLYSAVQAPRGISVLVMLLGGVLLTMTLCWAPFLQARFAYTNRFRCGFELREMRRLGEYAPIAWSLAIILLYALSLPLYLFKAFLLPPDAMWPITLIFVLTILPTRIITGWAYHVAVERKKRGGQRSHWLLRWTCSVLITALIGAYVFILHFTQFISEAGKLVLYQHHALLLPVPF